VIIAGTEFFGYGDVDVIVEHKNSPNRLNSQSCVLALIEHGMYALHEQPVFRESILAILVAGPYHFKVIHVSRGRIVESRIYDLRVDDDLYLWSAFWDAAFFGPSSLLGASDARVSVPPSILQELGKQAGDVFGLYLTAEDGKPYLAVVENGCVNERGRPATITRATAAFKCVYWRGGGCQLFFKSQMIPGERGTDDQIGLLGRLEANRDHRRDSYPGLKVIKLYGHHYSPDDISLALDSMVGLQKFRVKGNKGKARGTIGRQHLLLLTSPFAAPLHGMTEVDAFTMFCDIFQAIRFYTASQVLHRDISLGNVMRYGDQYVLVDLDQAIACDQGRVMASGQRTGTPLFMSTRNLEAISLEPDTRETVHDADDDIEGLVLLLVYIAFTRMADEATEAARAAAKDWYQFSKYPDHNNTHMPYQSLILSRFKLFVNERWAGKHLGNRSTEFQAFVAEVASATMAPMRDGDGEISWYDRCFGEEYFVRGPDRSARLRASLDQAIQRYAASVGLSLPLLGRAADEAAGAVQGPPSGQREP
jgi:hypothetical protein